MAKGLKIGIGAVLVLVLALPLRIWLVGQGGLPPGQRHALKNCIGYIQKSSFDNRKAIDAKAVKVQALPEEMKAVVWIVVDGPEETFSRRQQEHWLFTIGQTDGHSFVQLVCESTTGQVVGYIPVQ